MLRIFRRIRFSKMNFSRKEKILKYLPYALGEIILITIGLLLALSINNWNQSRNQYHKGTVFLMKLNEELNVNLKRLEYLQEKRVWNTPSHYSEQLDSIIRQLYKPETTPIERTRLFINSWTPRTSLNLRRNSYEEALNTGILSALETVPTSKTMLWSDERYQAFDSKLFITASTKLEDHIHFYYSWIDFRQRIRITIREKSDNAELKCSEGLGHLWVDNENLSRMNDMNKPMPLDTSRLLVHLDDNPWIKNKNSTEYMNSIQFLHNRRNENRSIRYDIYELSELTKNLIQMIEEELKNRKEIN